MLAEQGFGDVATLLQSGNVVLTTDRSRAELRSEVEAAIEKRFGFAVDVIVRDRAELAAVYALNPLADVAHDGSRYAVTFLHEPFAPDLGGVDRGGRPVRGPRPGALRLVPARSQ